MTNVGDYSPRLAEGENPNQIGNTSDDNRLSYSGFDCDESAVPVQPILQTLTKNQLANSLKDLVSEIYESPQATAISNFIDQEAVDLPDFSNPLSRQPEASNIEPIYLFLENVSAELFSSTERTTQFLSHFCGSGPYDLACFEIVSNRLSTRLLGRFETSEIVEEAMAVLAESPISQTLIAFMQFFFFHPNFLFNFDAEAFRASSTAYSYSALFYVRKLSLTTLDSIPPQSILSLVETNALSPQMRRNIVAELTADPRFKTRGLHAIANHYLNIENIRRSIFAPGDDVPTDQILPGVDFSNIGDIAANEVYALFEYVYDNDLPLSALFTTTKLPPFEGRETAARIYGVNDTNPEGFLEVPNHNGLLSRLFLTYTSEAAANPIARGVKINTDILCRDLPPPQNVGVDGEAIVVPPPSEFESKREQVSRITNVPGCYDCHQAIDPLGFMMGKFTGLGSFSSLELVVDDGELIGSHPVDTTALFSFGSNNSVELAGSEELSLQIKDYGEAEACLIEKIYEWSRQKNTNKAKDACFMQPAYLKARQNSSLKEVVTEMLLEPDLLYEVEE